MATILQTTFSNAFCLKENLSILIEILLKFIPEHPITNKSSLAQAMAWHLFGAKPLPDPMMTRFTDAYMHHSASL